MENKELTKYCYQEDNTIYIKKEFINELLVRSRRLNKAIQLMYNIFPNEDSFDEVKAEEIENNPLNSSTLGNSSIFKLIKFTCCEEFDIFDYHLGRNRYSSLINLSVQAPCDVILTSEDNGEELNFIDDELIKALENIKALNKEMEPCFKLMLEDFKEVYKVLSKIIKPSCYLIKLIDKQELTKEDLTTIKNQLLKLKEEIGEDNNRINWLIGRIEVIEEDGDKGKLYTFINDDTTEIPKDISINHINENVNDIKMWIM